MVNELRKNTSINADLQVNGLATVGIVAIAATSFCVCICMGMKHGVRGKVILQPQGKEFFT